MALGAEYLAVRQPSVIMHDAVPVVLQLDNEIAVVLHPADDEHIVGDWRQMDGNGLVDIRIADTRLDA